MASARGPRDADMRRQLAALAVPNAMAMLASQLLGVADSVIVGSLGAAPLAALTGAMSIVGALEATLFGFASGLRIAGAQAAGRGDGAAFGDIVRASLVVPFVLCGATCVGAFAFGGDALRIVVPRGAPLDAAWAYLAWRCLALAPMVASAVVVVALACAGDPRSAPRLMLLVNAVHIPLAAVLVYGVGTHRAFGLAGAGASSAIAEVIGLAFCVACVARRPDLRILDRRAPSARSVLLTARLSWPEVAFMGVYTGVEVAGVALVSTLGVNALAAFRAVGVVTDVTSTIPNALGEALEILVGRRIGAGTVAEADRFRRSATRFATWACVAAAAVFAVLAWPLAALCTLNASLATVAFGPLALHVVGTLPLKGYTRAVDAPLRAAGDNAFVMAAQMAGSLGALALMAFGIHAGFGLWSAPFGWIPEWVFRAWMSALRVRTGAWMRRPALAA